MGEKKILWYLPKWLFFAFLDVDDDYDEDVEPEDGYTDLIESQFCWMLSECVSPITIPWVLILRPGSIVQRADDQSNNVNKMYCAIHRVNSHLATRKSMLVQIFWRGDSG